MSKIVCEWSSCNSWSLVIWSELDRLLSRDWRTCFLPDQRFVNVRNDTTTGNGGLDERVQFFVSSNSQLQVTWSNTLYLQILRRVAGQFKHFGGQIFKNGCSVYGSRCSNTTMTCSARLQVTMNTTDRELKSSAGRARHRFRLWFTGIFASFASSLL